MRSSPKTEIAELFAQTAGRSIFAVAKKLEAGKLILDVACGGRAFWFDKQNPLVLFVDKEIRKPRIVGRGKDARVRQCLPDKVMDFRNLDLLDNQFHLVVFDPPHLHSLGKNSYTAQTYGRLDPETWRDDIKRGFSECFRVLRPNGILIFKCKEIHK